MSRSVHLLLPRQLLDAMVEQAQLELPNECCGLLAGVREETTLRVETRFPLMNEAASPVRYLSEPRSMFRASRAIDAAGHEILAIYHSHPTSDPVPSRTDLDLYYSSQVVHFIIGLNGPAPIVRGWWLTATEFEEAVWQIVE